MEFDLENPLPICHHALPSDTTVYLFNVESDHMPATTYHHTLVSAAADFHFSVRRETISLILQLSRRYDAVTCYLAVNYVDRFLSFHPLPEGRPWILKLVAASCVILALKMRKAEFSVSDIQQDSGVIFDLETIERMEMLILGTLKWRMRSVTPFCFLNFFISFFKFKEPPLRQALKARATEIIFKSQTEINLLKFRPSIISASALLSACDELFPLQFHCYRNAILNSPYVNTENLVSCYGVMQEIARKGYESVMESNMVSSSSTPVNVLDLQCWSWENDGSDTTAAGGAENSGCSGGEVVATGRERDLKRRKFDRFSLQGRCNKNGSSSSS
ncbi:PREDICTED: putative cyclin-D6-1 [Ipomoea nil]|uniref:putative cyclin-D6-1 n=1 Tax=Ipomoea nil TaxID=35883 RepID=UPI000901E838|nr:PREDICTED: putative cyclin-D6-1 [Ipomoea nil]